MAQISFSLVLPQWLAQWYLNRCGGSWPVKLPKGSLESIIVQQFSRPKSQGVAPDLTTPGALMIAFPENKAKPANVYNYLPPAAKVMLEKVISNIFDLCLFNDIVAPLFPEMLKKDLIYLWMEENNIEITESNWNAIDKRFSRLRKKLLAEKRSKKSRKKNSI